MLQNEPWSYRFELGIVGYNQLMLEERLNSCSPHWVRHSGPTIAINSGAISLSLASKMLGHSTLDTTSQMYYHPDDDKMLAGLDALGAQLG